MKKVIAKIAIVALVIGGLQLVPGTARAVTFTLAEVQSHNNATDCWTIVGGQVYNLTSFIADHPGGESAIIGMCGVDSTAAFAAIHGSSSSAQAALAGFLIGDLAVVDVTDPSVPAGLAASVISASQINLSWSASTDNVGVTGYNIYLDGALIGTSSVASSVVTGLTASTTYTFRVAAFDAAGNLSAQSAPVSATTMAVSPPDAVAPSMPIGLAASVISASQINLSWSASTDNIGVTGYNIYRDGFLVASSSVTSFSNTGLTASTTYTFRVAAFDAAGNLSAQSAPVSATTMMANVARDKDDADEDEDEDREHGDRHDGINDNHDDDDEDEDEDREHGDRHDGIHEDEHEDNDADEHENRGRNDEREHGNEQSDSRRSDSNRGSDHDED